MLGAGVGRDAVAGDGDLGEEGHGVGGRFVHVALVPDVAEQRGERAAAGLGVTSDDLAQQAGHVLSGGVGVAQLRPRHRVEPLEHALVPFLAPSRRPGRTARRHNRHSLLGR